MATATTYYSSERILLNPGTLDATTIDGKIGEDCYPGQVVYFEGALQYNAARGEYKIVRLVPVERDNKVVYRIKNSAEAFERTAEEFQLTLAPA